MILVGSEVGYWVAIRSGARFREEESQALGWGRPDFIESGVIYEDWNGKSIVSHIAAEGILDRRFIRLIFDYPFNQIGASKIIAPIASINSKAINFVSRLGFSEEARLRDAHPRGDLLLYTMHRTNCRWIKE